MTVFLLLTLFATVAIASALTLADAVVRGRGALRQVRGELGRAGIDRRVIVDFVYTSSEPRMPALRPCTVSAGRSSQRRTARESAPLRAAA